MVTKVRILHDTVIIPTGSVATTQGASDNTTKVATTAYVTTALANLADSAPSTLNTLNELAAALGDDANFSTTVTDSIATKLPLAGGTLTGVLTGTEFNVGVNYAGKFNAKQSGADAYGIVLEASGTDAWLRMGHTGTYAQIDATYNSSAGHTPLQLLAGGSARIHIATDGKVGVGTASPDSILHVLGTENGEGASIGQLRVQSSTVFGSSPKAGIVFTNQHTTGSQAIMGGIYVGKDTTVDTNYSGHMAFSTRLHGAVSQERMRITSTGKVGIGTDSPAAGLQVSKGLTNGGGPAAGASTASACFGNDGSDDNYGLVLGADGNGLGYISAQRTDGTATAYPLVIQHTGGKVGIGETTPDDTLHVNAAGGVARIRIGSGNDAYYAKKGYLGDTWYFGSGETGDSVTSTISGGAFTSSNAGGAFIWKTDDAGTLSEKMRITSDGKVGIGESAPSNAKLEILQAGDHNAHSTHGIAIHSTGNTNFTSMYMGAEDGIDSAYIQSAALDGSFTSKSLLLNANGGNVGIGTTDPDGFKTKITSAAKGLFVQSGSGGYTSLGFTGDGGTTKGSITSTSGLLYFGSENSGGTGSNGEIRVTPGTGNVMAIDGANSYVGIGTSSPGNRLEVGSNNQRNGISLRGGANGNAVMVEMMDAKTGSFSTVTVDIQYSGAGGYGYEIHTYGTNGSFYQVGGGYTNNTPNFSHSVSQTNGSTWTVSSPSNNLLRVVAPAGGTHPGIHVKAFGALSVGLDQTDITITYA